MSSAGVGAFAVRPAAAAAHENGTTRARPASWIETNDGTSLFCQDWGTGRPIVFLHGLGSSCRQWQYNTVPLASQGFRCIAYDRRSHGRSSDPGKGYDYDTLAADLAAVVDQLDLRDATLVAHSMAAGEIVRYVTRYGRGRVARLVMTGPTLPFILKTPDNPHGFERNALDALRAAWLSDYPKWVVDNARPFFTPETSQATVEWGVGLLIETSLKAIIDCHHSLTETDFRSELAGIDVPTLIIHGEKDVSAAIDFTGKRTAKLIQNCKFLVYEDAAHGLFITHAQRFNNDVAEFAGS